MAINFIHVHFMNKSSKAFIYDPKDSAEKLRQMVVDRLELKEHKNFDLFEVIDDIERCIEPDEKPYDIFKNSDNKDAKKHFLLFKKKIFIDDSIEIEKELEDPIALNLIYQQAVSDIITSTLPCPKIVAIRLAGHQMQVLYGEYNPDFHKENFLLKNPQNNLNFFLPKIINIWKKPNELEKLILREYALLKELKTVEETKYNYINIVRTLPLYGTTFFPPCRLIENKNISGKIIIGINYDGIVLLKAKTNEFISEHPYQEICNWSYSSKTFIFEFICQSEPQKHCFETKHGKIISSTIQSYIDIHIQRLRYENDDDENNTTYIIN